MSEWRGNLALNDPRLGDEISAQREIVAWLTANGIDANKVPLDPNCTVTGGWITLTMKVSGPGGIDVLVPGKNDVFKETRTFPLLVEPTGIVRIWLAPKCPTCGR